MPKRIDHGWAEELTATNQSRTRPEGSPPQSVSQTTTSNICRRRELGPLKLNVGRSSRHGRRVSSHFITRCLRLCLLLD